MAKIAIGGKPHSARVLHGAKAFLHDQALLWDRQIYSSAYLFPREPVVISVRIVPEQGEMKPVFAAG